MQFVILDPSLQGTSSHHYAWADELVRAASRRGWTVRIATNQRYPFAELSGAAVTRHFRQTGYPESGGDPVRGRYDAFVQGNESLLADLGTLPKSVLADADLVLCPTATASQLDALVRWRAELHGRRPMLVVWLMLPTGVELDATGAVTVVDPLEALFYKLALDRARTVEGLTLMASGAAHAAEYGALFGAPIEAHAVLLSAVPDPGNAEPLAERRVLLHAGDAKIEKGTQFVPELVRLVRTSLPGWRSVVHTNFLVASGTMRDVAPAIDRLVLDDPDIDLRGGLVSPHDYSALFQASTFAVLAYDPKAYRRRSSGVLWELLAMGIPAVLPEGTWLENEFQRWGGRYEPFERWSAGSIFAAVRRLAPDAKAARRSMHDVSARFIAANGSSVVLDQLARIVGAPATDVTPVSRDAERASSLDAMPSGRSPWWRFGRKPARDRALTKPAAATTRPTLPVAATAKALTARRTLVVEYYTSEAWEHLRLRLDGAIVNGTTLDSLTFKVFRTPSEIGLEFRTGDEAGDHPFAVFPGDDADQFGPVYRLSSDRGGERLSLPDADRIQGDDRSTLELVIASLPATMANASIVIGHLDLKTYQDWIASSAALPRALALAVA